MSTVRDTLATNLARVEQRIAAACARAGRTRDSVTLVAVTKSVSSEVAAELVALGVRDLGESRPQELLRKVASLPAEVRWHAIGHLQRNKVERTVPVADLIHSVDSMRLLEALEAVKTARPINVLLEVNVTVDPNKHGFDVEFFDATVVSYLRSLQRVRILGLMTMAAYEAAPEQCRATFAQLARLTNGLQHLVGDRHLLRELSMGMSNDFEVAIEEGATLIRLGSVLFEGLPE